MSQSKSDSVSVSGGKTGRRKLAAQTVEFDNNVSLREVCGENDRFLALIEQKLDVTLFPRGNQMQIAGMKDNVALAAEILAGLYKSVAEGKHLEMGDVEGAIRMALGAVPGNAPISGRIIRTQKKNIEPRSQTQATYMAALATSEMVFGLGPAGTGKTYIAVAQGVSMLLSRAVDRLVLSRPAVEAGERLGFLPGDMRDKIDPYLRPLYDALHDTMVGDQLERRLEAGDIEVAPLAFMRGRTLANAYVILDEAQNATPMQMKMFLTRLGENSRMVITGDPTQTDLPPGQDSGLTEACSILKGVKGIEFVQFSAADVVRHALVSRIVTAYDEVDSRAH
jgi:phosphate starvation-inducible PhoH-like protein